MIERQVLRRGVGWLVVVALFCGWVFAALHSAGLVFDVTNFLIMVGAFVVTFLCLAGVCKLLDWCFSDLP